jgi:type IV pilus assembly protein PilX
MQAIASHGRQRGYVIIVSMLIILMITVMSISMAKSFFLEEGMAGNVREKSRSFALAQAALHWAELQALQSGGSGVVTCATSGTLSLPSICNNAVTLVTGAGSVPLKAYTPLTATQIPTAILPATLVSHTPAANTVYDYPGVYIQNMGATRGNGFLYQVTAFGYGGTSTSISEVQSTFLASCGGGKSLIAGVSPC